MDLCAGTELSELQQQLTPALTKDSALFGSAAVEKVQAAWVHYRDSECALEASSYKGGTIQPLIRGNCEVTLTAQRLLQIREVVASDVGH